MSTRPTKSSCDHVTEVAMAIAEKVASLSQATQPIATDVPLMLATLDPSTVVQLHAWLQGRYDWEDDKRLLFDEDVSAEGLAKDIVDSRGDIAGSPVACSVTVDNDFASRSPRPSTGDAFLDIGMAPYESWTGKTSRKASVLYGLLGLGLLGSPLSPSMLSPGNGLCRSTPLGFGSPSLEPRAPASAYTPIFSPWLKTLRVSGMDPVQSPWVPSLPHRSMDGLWAFPQSPRAPC